MSTLGFRLPAEHQRQRRLHGAIASLAFCFALCLTLIAFPAAAQTAGQGTIEGTVTDPSGAVIGNASVTATNVATNMQSLRKTSSAGFFVIAPLPPGTYSVTVTMPGFKKLVQNNIVVNALAVRSLTLKLSVGEASQTISVTSAPPVLDTADATIGLTVQHEMYANLPLQMSGMQRDPTAFGTLSPGTKGGDRLPVVGGTGNYLGQLYLDGMPSETISQQGDNRLVSQAVDVDAVDQFQFVTSTPPAEYMGAGAENFTLKSGGLHYHGQVSDFVRNTVFDAWSFTNKHATVKNAQGQSVPAPKPPEHQNELSVSLGGPVPHTGHKLFFFFAYDKYHTRTFVSPSLLTVPTPLMRQGDFTELNGGVGSGGMSGTGSDNPALLFDPTTNSCAGGTCSRQPFQGTKNGVATNNVIPAGDISPIAQAMQSFLPDPTNPGSLTNNYLGSIAKGFDNHVIDWRVDWDVSAKQRISTLGTMGSTNYLNNYGSPYLPLPYTGGDLAAISPKNFMVEDDYTFTPHLVNQVKYGFTRFFQNIHNSTQGIKKYEIGTFGITNVPGGQAGEEFPGAAFGSSSTGASGIIPSTWTGHGNSVSTQLTTPNNYALTDNLLWQKGKHALTIGATFQWQQINNANPSTLTGVLAMNYNSFSTANFDGANLSKKSGYAYASYLLGAVGGSASSVGSSPGLGINYVSELAGRYKTFSPYIQDQYKVTQKLTLDLGLRWDYLPPFHELKDRWTFFNPNIMNPATGTKGMLQFAGNYGGPGVSCGCKTPVHTYYGNWGPRIGLAYTFTPKTVLRAGYAQVFSQAGGVGGRGGAANGTGQTGFNTTAIGPTDNGSGITAGPSYYLNPNSGYLGAQANTDLFGKGYTYPAAPPPGLAAQELNTGNYVDPGTGAFVRAAGVSYPDPYFSGRAPELELYNFGIEQAITRNMTLAINYVGNESHFMTDSKRSSGNLRGYWSGEMDPRYLAGLGNLVGDTGAPLLTSRADPANVAAVLAVFPDAPHPQFIQDAAAKSSTATIAQMLLPFPQYSGMSDSWGNVGNYNYQSLQVTLEQRMNNGLTFNFNLTWSRNIGDQRTFRSGYDIPAAAISHGVKGYKMDAMDRGLTTEDTPIVFHGYGVYQLPFGRGHIGGNSRLVSWLAGGWQVSGIYTFSSGTPLAISGYSGCSGGTGSSASFVGQGTCMPDLNSKFTGPVRINGNFGKGPNGYQFASLGKVNYLDSHAFSAPQSFPGTGLYLIGNAPVTAAYGLRNPSSWNLDMGLHRSFPLHWEGSEFVFEADVANALNHVIFKGPGTGFGSSSFGTVTGIANTPRDWQFAGHFNF